MALFVCLCARANNIRKLVRVSSHSRVQAGPSLSWATWENIVRDSNEDKDKDKGKDKGML